MFMMFVLEMGLEHVEGLQARLWFRFFRPGDAAESSLGLSAPLPVRLDPAVLRAASGSPGEYGRLLAEMVFSDPLARVAFSTARAAADRAPLHARLFIDPFAPDMQAVRWEMLYDLDRRVMLAADENIYFSRALSSASMQSFTPPTAERLRALVMIANPALANLSSIDVNGELERARGGLQDMELTCLVGPGQATLDGLLAGLQAGCDVLYFVAHGLVGERPRVFLEHPDGSPDPVEVDVLLERLRGLARLPLLAVLISCESAGDGSISPMLALGPRLLAETGIPAVIAMQGQVSFPTVERFMPVFFHELQRDGQIDRALSAARARVMDRPDWWMPVLFSRLRDNRLLAPPPLARPLDLQPYEPETVYIPAGVFLMGREGDEAPPAEQPAHPVSLPAFRMGQSAVTNRQFAEYVRQQGVVVNPEAGWEGQTPPSERLDDPVVGVTWYQALDYCRWLREKTGRAYALPTEAQWEKAARGTDGRLYPWGKDAPGGPERSRLSPFDCADMVGGVREWTLSLWGSSMAAPDYAYPWDRPYAPGRNDPQAGEQVLRVVRGGSLDGPFKVTCASRGGFLPAKTGFKGGRHGFRVVLNPSVEEGKQ